MIALNKVDRLKPPAILESIAGVSGLLEDYVALHPVSARTGDGVEELEAELVALLPEGPAYFEDGVDSDQPLERRIGELVREQALARTREEVPHAIAVDGRGDQGAARQALRARHGHPDRRGHEPAGHSRRQGRRDRARDRHALRGPQIEKLVGGSIYLDLRVKVRRGWRRDDSLLERFGL